MNFPPSCYGWKTTMRPKTDTFPKTERLPLPEWKALVHEWIAVKAGQVDTRHGGKPELWDEHIRRSMPIFVRSPELALFAVEAKDPDVLEIVYSGVLPSAHIDYLHENDLTPCQMTLDALLGFQERFGVKPKFREYALHIRKALQDDNEALLNRVPDLTERDIFYAFRVSPSLLEHTKDKMAPLMSDFLHGWVKFYGHHLLSVFLDCAKAGYAKTVNAILSAGFNPYDFYDENISKAGVKTGVFGHSREKAAQFFPPSFCRTLAILDPDIVSSSHARLSRSALFAKGATVEILKQDPEIPFAGISRQDWRDCGLPSKEKEI